MSQADTASANRTPPFTFRMSDLKKAQIAKSLAYNESVGAFVRDAIDEKLEREDLDENLSEQQVREILGQ